jgi:hypothetical protein
MVFFAPTLRERENRMPARIDRRRFLWLAASAAATGAVMACQQAPRVAT